MSQISRRSFLQISTVTPFALSFPDLMASAAVTPVTRSEARTAAGVAMLAKYAKAVTIMKDTVAIPVGNPLSWQFQWFIHWTPKSKAALLQQVYPGGAPAAWKNTADQTWATCQAHFQPFSREKFFLPWHRWYVAFFEAIIREIIHDQSFALPYWDYAQNPALPDQFRMMNDPTFKSLFHQNRGLGVGEQPVNDGAPIDAIQAVQKMMHDALCQTQYINATSDNPGFCDHLDFNLHGTVHGAIGGDMGSVPTAAQDPIFWMHHCNIDRLWESWFGSGGKNPNDATFLNEPFTFADPHGNSATKRPGGALDIGGLGYQYDRLEPRPGDCPSFAQPESVAAPQVTHRTSGPITVGNDGASFSLQPVSGGARETAGGRSWLIIGGVSAPVVPGTIYQVFLNLPEGSNAKQREASRVGQINFFDVMAQEGHEREDKVFSFALAGINIGSAPSVTILPRGTVPSDVRVTVKRIEVIRR
jgi:tyrosinase